VRYQKVLARKQHDPSLSLVQLAYAGGYADQAHFTREFSRISGYTPKRAFELCPAFSDYYTYA
jgi:AraC-like DNA-binding protein